MSSLATSLHELLHDDGSGMNLLDCRSRKDPITLQAMMLEVLHTVYTPTEHLPKHVTAYKDGLQIKLAGVWSYQDLPDGVKPHVDERPAIAVDLQDIKYTDRAKEVLNETLGMGLENGLESQVRLAKTSLEIKHLGATKAQVQLYASTTLDLLAGFAHGIKSDLCLEKLEISSILKPKLRRAEPEDWECSVIVYVEYEDTFSTYVESPKYKDNIIKIITN